MYRAKPGARAQASPRRASRVTRQRVAPVRPVAEARQSSSLVRPWGCQKGLSHRGLVLAANAPTSRDSQPRAATAHAVAADIDERPAPSAEELGILLDKPLEPHPEVVRGRLENGFEYVILPNRSPPGRFEAHLQMHIGSVDEGPHEQGIAHFVEHVTFLGSKKRESLLSLGGRSNAYTDFQHTIFHVHAPLRDQMSAAPLLQYVIETLHDVAFNAEFLRTRIEKERKAVLAEAQMMNTIEYRMDCQLLRYLHDENLLGHRFPIGMVDQVKEWDRETLYNFWKKWYFPANATLYVVGDLGAADGITECLDLIKATFGKEPRALAEDGTPKERHPVRPPVVHHWGCGPLRKDEVLPCKVSMFRHPLVSNYILSVFAKLPIHPMDTLRNIKEVLIQRILVSVFQRRIGARYIEGDAKFYSIDFEIADSSREGTCVVSLTITAEPRDWEGATRAAVQEAQRLQQHGITRSELEQYMEALLNDGSQLAASTDTQAHIEMMDLLMETLSNKQVFNSNLQSYEAMLAVAPTVTLQDVNSLGRSYFAFISDYGREAETLDAAAAAPPGHFYEPGPVRATSLIACVPTFVQESGEAIEGGLSARGGAKGLTTDGHLDGSGIDVDAVSQPGVDDAPPPDALTPPPGSVIFQCFEEDIQRVMSERHELEPLAEVDVPDTFIPDDDMSALLDRFSPEFVPVPGREREGPLPGPEATSGVVQRRLSNGVAVNYKQSTNEPGSALMRVCFSGGRAAEPRSGEAPAGVGSMQVGMRTLSESGTVADCRREEVEMFCLSRLINCLIDTDVENMFIDWHFQSSAAGIRGVLELVHLMVERPRWDSRAFERAKIAIAGNHRAVHKSLERANHDRVVAGIFGDDRRFRDPTPAEVDALTLDGVRDLVHKYMRPDNLEVTVVGDFDAALLEELALQLLGTIAPRSEPSPLPHAPIEFARGLPLEQRHQVWHLDDSDERGMGNIAGVAFRRWGDIYGSGPVSALSARVAPPPPASESSGGSHTALALQQTLRRAHPLFAATSLLFLQEIVNARLFVTVRDQLNLTYDVSFEIVQQDRLNACWWCVNVTAAPPKIAEATQASLNVLRECKSTNKISWWEVERTRQTLLARHEADLKDNNYILNLVTHLQAPDVPLKTIDCLRDLPAMMRTVTATDLNDAFALFGTNDDEVVTSIGTAGPVPPATAPRLRMQSELSAAGDRGAVAASATAVATEDGTGGRAVSDMLMSALAKALTDEVQKRKDGETGGGAGSAGRANGTSGG